MQRNIEAKIERHIKFLQLQEVERPLIGCCIGGWDQFGKYLGGNSKAFPEGYLTPGDIHIENFLELYEYYFERIDFDDDLIRTAEPFPAIPWCEAAVGCPIRFSGKNFWSEPVKVNINEFFDALPRAKEIWMRKYEEFLFFLDLHFSGRYPVAQSILRGPLDLLSAVLGEMKMVYDITDEPNNIKKLISVCGDVFTDFLRLQNEKTKRFYGGHVIGQYYIWTPGPCARLQEDATSFLSPELYDKFVFEQDLKIAGVCEYNLFHIHASSLFLIESILKNEKIKIVQISKDDGNTGLENMLPALQRIQKEGKCLLLKGRFNARDCDIIKQRLDKQGLCVQFVVDAKEEAEEILKLMKEVWN